MDIFFLLLTIEEKSGGLFDFDGTITSKDSLNLFLHS